MRRRRMVTVVAIGAAAIAAAAVAVAASRTDAPTTQVFTDVPAGETTTTTDAPAIGELTTTTVETPSTSTTSTSTTSTTAPTVSTTTAAPVIAPAAQQPGPERCFAGAQQPPRNTPVVAVVMESALKELPVSGGAAYTVPADAGERVFSAAWSPDRRLVAWRSQQRGVVVTDLARGCERVIQPLESGHHADGFAWRPDGRGLAYTESWNYGGPPAQVVVVGPDGAGRKVVKQAQGGVAWAPDGSNRIAFGDREGLKVMDLDSGTERTIHPTTGGAEFPQWSPDGKRITFSISLDSAVWIADADGTQGRKLVDKWQVFFTNWSPDGSRVAYLFQGGVWIVNADGSGDRKVPVGADVHALPRWSPDGKSIAVTKGMLYQGDTAVTVVDLDGTSERPIADDGIAVDFFVRS